jgi:signal transduction histidine kinase
MLRRVSNFAITLSLVQRFTLASFIVMILGILGIGRWVTEQIRLGVIKETAATTALYMDSFISPHLQELGSASTLTPYHFEALASMLSEANLGRQTVAIKIWSTDRHVLYSDNPALIGRDFPETKDRLTAWQGEVTAEISELEEEENVEERLASHSRLLEIYSPVRLNGTSQVIAVTEFYQKIDVLEAEIAAAQKQSWFVVGATMGVIYLLLIGFVQYASNTIKNQENELKSQVKRLTELLVRNDELNKRVRRAAANATAFNERFLRRTSAELHSGPIQEIELAFTRLERVKSQNETCRLIHPNAKLMCTDHLPTAKQSLKTALDEIRGIAAGLALPHLEYLTLPEILMQVVHVHEQHTGTKVMLSMSDLPEQTPLEIKITAYRLIQEALNNAHNYAGGAGQQVRVRSETNDILIEISDQGPGFDINRPVGSGEREHLGLAGMRERVESLGGSFGIESKINQGTKIIAVLTLQNNGENGNG